MGNLDLCGVDLVELLLTDQQQPVRLLLEPVDFQHLGMRELGRVQGRRHMEAT